MFTVSTSLILLIVTILALVYGYLVSGLILYGLLFGKSNKANKVLFVILWLFIITLVAVRDLFRTRK